jgi:hypothetical protein
MCRTAVYCFTVVSRAVAEHRSPDVHKPQRDAVIAVRKALLQYPFAEANGATGDAFPSGGNAVAPSAQKKRCCAGVCSCKSPRRCAEDGGLPRKYDVLTHKLCSPSLFVEGKGGVRAVSEKVLPPCVAGRRCRQPAPVLVCPTSNENESDSG